TCPGCPKFTGELGHALFHVVTDLSVASFVAEVGVFDVPLDNLHDAVEGTGKGKPAHVDDDVKGANVENIHTLRLVTLQGDIAFQHRRDRLVRNEPQRRN